MPTPKRKPKPKPRKSAAKRTARKPPVRTPGVTGPTPAVLTGFTYNPPAPHPEHNDTRDVGAEWRRDTPAEKALRARSMGATWDLAASIAHLHPSTVRNWNLTGARMLTEFREANELVGNTRGESGDLAAEFHATDPPRDQLAFVCFHLASEEAAALAVVAALSSISRAAGSDWKAAAHLLRVLPQAASYRPDPRLEVVGPEGGPIEVSVRSQARTRIEAMADRLAANLPEGTES